MCVCVCIDAKNALIQRCFRLTTTKYTKINLKYLLKFLKGDRNGNKKNENDILFDKKKRFKKS